MAEYGVRGINIHHVLRLYAEGAICELQAVPGELLVIERPYSGDHAHGILELAREPVDEPAGNLHELVSS
ncbi:MAG: hypothetical protein ABSB79_10685, partial [Syntrophales bacterium]